MEDKAMVFLSRDDLLRKREVRTEVVQIPEWGGSVRVKALSGTERDSLEQKMLEGKRPGKVSVMGFRSRLVMLGTVDEEGKRVFQETDLPSIGEMDGAVLDRIATCVGKLSGYSDEEMEKLEGN